MVVAYLLYHLSLFPESLDDDLLCLITTSSYEEISLSTKKTEERLKQLDG
jgi:translation elongation factor P/translation initiation factor 5A